MPIYEYACPKCRVIFSFLSRRVTPNRLPVCPRCGNKRMAKTMSRFATLKGIKEPSAAKPGPGEGEPPRRVQFGDPAFKAVLRVEAVRPVARRVVQLVVALDELEDGARA